MKIGYMVSEYYAHSKEGVGPEGWHKLEDHLQAVAEMARDFAAPFGGGDWAYLAGLWHDLGKYSDEFQKKLYEANGIETHLETKPGKVVHSHAGGHWAQQVMSRGLERIYCWLIMGHHTGLADFASDRTGARALEPKMRNPEESGVILAAVPDEIKNRKQPPPPEILLKEKAADVSFFIRMIFSCVVDADFLDTEAFMNRGRGTLRRQKRPLIGELLDAFDRYVDQKCRDAEQTPINEVRANVLHQCRAAALRKSSVFSLTVPTGGGKTLSSLAYALKHASRWNKRRVIYVIPYTSIIEQTAEVFREIPGFADAVLEHHSSIATDDETKESVRRRLASENWDAPIIVTTSVQFFESLYGCKTSRCRKLHNIVNSVVVFDEAQCLPPSYIRPAVFAIRELHRHYGVTPVLCTATQPVLTQTEQFDFALKEGFEEVTEIIEDPASLSRSLGRVQVTRYADLVPVSHAILADSIQAEGRHVLCIVNRKRDCRELATLLPDDQTIHLSTNMCAKHRLKVFAEVQDRLGRDDEPLFVISTSLVEAGVDLDFTVVYRALAGLDSVAQAAGRCNREGKRDKGKTAVFLPESQPDYVTAPASLAREFLTLEKIDDVFLPETFNSYFRQRFFQLGTQALDEKNILKLLGGNLDFYYRTAAERLNIIDDSWQQPLIVPYGESPTMIDRLLEYDARNLFRSLQAYTIKVSRQVMRDLVDAEHARELAEYPGVYYLHDKGLYSQKFGFVPPTEIDGYDPQDLMS